MQGWFTFIPGATFACLPAIGCSRLISPTHMWPCLQSIRRSEGGISRMWEWEFFLIRMCVSTEHGWLHGHVTWAVTQGLAIGKIPGLVLGSAKGSSCNSFFFFF